MTEKALNDVIRNLRVAAEHLEIAKTYSEVGLHDHNVTMGIQSLKLDIMEFTSDMDTLYRSKHYPKKHQR